MTSAPVYIDATGDLWMAANEVVYRVPATGSECSYDVGERITTDLVKNATGTAVFFGTESGSVFAVGGSILHEPRRGTTAALGRRNRRRKRQRRRGDLLVRRHWRDGAGRVRPRAGIPQRDDSPCERRAGDVADAPAILVNSEGDDALVVFVAGQKREGRDTRPILQGWDTDLSKYETVSVWSTSVSFLFKPEEDGVAAALLRPVVDPETFTLLVASSDGYSVRI